jgi:dCMP deaminase
MNELDYLREACRFAVQHSHDNSTQAGAILVTPRKTLYAANVLPPGIARVGSRLTPPYKYSYTEHAERAVIYKAAAVGIPTAGSTLFCPWFACTDCARAIILSGIKEVVGLISLRCATPARWVNSIELASQMMTEAGVSQRLMAGKVGVTIRFDGRDFPC